MIEPQSGAAFDADPLLLDSVYGYKVSGSVRVIAPCYSIAVRTVILGDSAARWMGLNDDGVSPERAVEWMTENAVPLTGPVHVRIVVKMAAGAACGNYAVTGALYRARWHRALAAGALPREVRQPALEMMLRDPAADIGGTEGARECAAGNALFRVGVHVRRGDIMVPRCGRVRARRARRARLRPPTRRYIDRALSEEYYRTVLARVLDLLPPCLLMHTFVSVRAAPRAWSILAAALTRACGAGVINPAGVFRGCGRGGDGAHPRRRDVPGCRVRARVGGRGVRSRHERCDPLRDHGAGRAHRIAVRLLAPCVRVLAARGARGPRVHASVRARGAVRGGAQQHERPRVRRGGVRAVPRGAPRGAVWRVRRARVR